MSVDLAHPAAEKIVLVLEGIGDDKVRVNSASLDYPLVILADQGIEIVGIAKKVMVGSVARSAYWLIMIRLKKSGRNASHSLHRLREHQADARLSGEKGAGSTWSHMSQRSSCNGATATQEFRDFAIKGSIDETRPRPSGRREDHPRPGVIGDDKIRVNSWSLDHPLVILPDQGLEIVGIEKKVMEGRVARSAYWLNHDPSGLTEAGYGPATK
jgi:hypothetical protein